MDYKKYMELVNRYYETDNREVNYQNRVIIPFFEELLGEEYDVVDVSQLTKQWKKIDRDKFAGYHTPDILVAKKWRLRKGKEDDTEYLLLVEVKSPTAKDREHAEREVGEYIHKIQNVILTDCLTWEFYPKREGIKDVCLEKKYSEVVRIRNGRYRTREEYKEIEYDFPARVCERYAIAEIRWQGEETWKELCKQIKMSLEYMNDKKELKG